MKKPEVIEEARLAGALSTLGRSDDGPPLPDPAAIWRRAQLLDALEARRRAAWPVEAAHRFSLALTAVALLALAGSEGVSLLRWLEAASGSLMLPLTLSLFLLGGGLFLAAGAAVGRNLARRSER